MGDKLHGREGNNPDHQLRSQSPPKLWIQSRKALDGRRAFCCRMKSNRQGCFDDAEVIMPERVARKRARNPFTESPRFPEEG